jgi:hypothetical protein
MASALSSSLSSSDVSDSSDGEENDGKMTKKKELFKKIPEVLNAGKSRARRKFLWNWMKNRLLILNVFSVLDMITLIELNGNVHHIVSHQMS